MSQVAAASRIPGVTPASIIKIVHYMHRLKAQGKGCDDRQEVDKLGAATNFH